MDTFENVLGQFENSEVFPFFWNFSTSRPSRVQWTKNFNEIASKHVWTLLGTFLDTFEFSNCFRFFFRIFPSFDPTGCTGQEKIEKITSSKFGHFLKRFSGFWNFEIFSIFVDFSWVSRVHWAQRFPSKKSIKTFSGHVFGNVFGRFWKFQSFSFF